MASLSQAKTLGGVGSILVLLSVAPVAGGILAIAGFIMTLIAVKYVSDVVGDKAIFNNMIISVILSIVGVVVAVVFVLGSVMQFIGFGNMYNSMITSSPITPANIATSDLIGLITGIVVGLVLLWIFFLISAVFLRKSYNSIKAKLNIGMFGTAALLYLIGFVLLFVAQILLVVAFFSIPDSLPAPPSMQAAPSQSS
jgi:uncharacterized membrane protein